MSKGPTSADKSLLLDYISPALIVSFFTASKNRHFIVVTTILGFALIKLLTVASTGLFQLQDGFLTNSPINLTALDRFDGTNFRADAVDSRPTIAQYAIRNFGLSPPVGVVDQYVFQNFNASSRVSPRSVLSGVVDYITTGIDCEIGNLTMLNNEDDGYTNFSVVSSSCKANISLATTGFEYGGHTDAINCTNLPLNDAGDSNRIFIGVLHTFLDDVGRAVSLYNASGIICKPKYNIGRATVSINATTPSSGGVRLIVHTEQPNRTLPEVSPWDLANGVLVSVPNAISIIPPMSLANYRFLISPNTTRPTHKLSALLDARLLEVTARQEFTDIANQVAKQYLMVSATDQFRGTYDHFEWRVHVQYFPLVLMQAVLVILIILTIAIFIIAPQNVISRNPDSIAAISTIMARSPDVVKLIMGMGHSSLEAIREVVGERVFQTSMTDKFQIKTDPPVAEEAESDTMTQSPHSHDIGWWRPLALNPYIISLVLVAPIGLMIALEAFYQQSVKHNGLADVASDGYVHYVWNYIPTVVLLLVATLFNILSFDTMTFQPYLTLHRGGATARDSILSNPLGKMTVFTAWDSIRYGQIMMLVSAITVLVAPMLTIVVSGLYSAGGSAYSNEIGIQQLTWFNRSADYTFYVGDSINTAPSLTTNLIGFANLSYPAWTYKDLALPSIAIKPVDRGGSYFNNATSLSVRMPAVRSRLNCTVFPTDKTPRVSIEAETVVPTILVNISTPDKCSYGDSDYMGSWLGNPSLPYAEIWMKRPPTGYFGRVMAMGRGSCPSIAVIFGYCSKCEERVDGLKVLKCLPYMQQLEVNVSFTLPDLSIDTSHPPIANESTVQGFPTEMATIKEADFQAFNMTGDELDDIFTNLIFGKFGVPATELLDEDRLIRAIEDLYPIYMTQILNGKRITADPDTSALVGVYTNPYRTRLHQSLISTRILQALLALLFLCAVVSYALTDTGKVLPQNPHTLIAVGSLLAGSEMLREELNPPGAEWWDDSEAERKGIFTGRTFSLGWWGGGEEGSRRRFGIDIGVAEKTR
ncbi:MAG: hypothetical protein M1840_002761 [Geoglossum simile]|nr:MAG: hypothetical protein M1840_002761 [Geoglossum simile]